jgi:site-specific DNA recombinase
MSPAQRGPAEHVGLWPLELPPGSLRELVVPATGPAVAEACAILLGGGTLSGVMRGWTAAGVRPVQSTSGRGWTRQSIRTILLNPRIAGLSAYRGEIVGRGDWEPLVSEETWRAVRAILEDPARKPPRGVRTLPGGLALRPCGNVVSGMPNHRGQRVYRCQPPTRNRDWDGGHVARQAGPVEDYIEMLVKGRMAREDAADLIALPEGARMSRRWRRSRRRSARPWRRWPPTARSG